MKALKLSQGGGRYKMKPILYSSTETNFNTNGIGILSDAVSCFVIEERNGAFELEMQYPIDGLHYKSIIQRSIICAKPNPTGDIQPFRVYRITKPINGLVTVYAEHISYDLSGIAVTPFEAGSVTAALQALKTNSVINNPFEFWTDKSTTATMKVKTPASVRAMLGGVANSVLDTYGGEYEWDKYTVKLYNARGANRGVSVRYGKNLTNIEQEENCSKVYTAVMPYWADADGNCTMLDEKLVTVEGNFDFSRVLTVDFSMEFENQPTQEQLRARAQKYIKANKIGIPKVSLELSFVQLEQTEEYKNNALLERVNLCDTVNVEFEKLGVSATSKVIKTIYNVLLNRYESVELGEAKSTIADTIAKQEQDIKYAPKKAISAAAQAAENATQLITGNRGGYVVIHSSTGASEPDEILIMDTPSIETARKVWRWNNSGLGFSENGYNGPYTSAWTIDGAFNADFITAGTISANLIKSGLLQSLNEKTSIDMNNGEFKIKLADNYFMTVSDDGIEFIKEGKTYAKFTSLRTVSHYADFDTIEVHEPSTYTTVALLNSSTSGGSLSLNNLSNGETKVDLRATETGGSISFYRQDGNIGTPIGTFKADSSDGSIIQITNGNGTITGELKTKSGAGGQLELRNESGKATFSFSNASGGGAECWIGQGNGVYKFFDYKNGINVHADHFNFYGKSSGLFYSGGLSTSNCSAYIVYGQPTSGGYWSSVIIPSAIATNKTWQIADESNYISFTISSDGTVTRKGGSSGSLYIYSIR